MARKLGKESKGKRGPRKLKDMDQRPSGRLSTITTFKPNGPESTVVAPEPASIDLGPVVLPSPDDAVKVLGVLAELNDRTLQAHARFVDSQTKTKQLKSKWEELAAELQKKLRAATHGSDLPLFDVNEREQDTRAMEQAAVTQESAQDASSQIEGSAGTPSVETAPTTFQEPNSVF